MSPTQGYIHLTLMLTITALLIPKIMIKHLIKKYCTLPLCADTYTNPHVAMRASLSANMATISSSVPTAYKACTTPLNMDVSISTATPVLCVYKYMLVTGFALCVPTSSISTTTPLCNLVTGFAVGVLKSGISITTSQCHCISTTTTQYHPFVTYFVLSLLTSSTGTMEQYNSQLHYEILMVSPCCKRRTFALLLMESIFLRT